MNKNIEEIIYNFEDRFHLLNDANGLIIHKNLIAQLVCDFDYDMNGYNKGVDQHHFFTGSYVLHGITKKIFSAHLEEIFFVTDDLVYSTEFKKHKEAYEQKYEYSPETDEVLTESLMNDPNTPYVELHPDLAHFCMNNSLVDISSPSFKKLEIIGLDNTNSAIKFHGTLYGDSHALTLVENQKAFMQLALVCSSNNLPFYKELLLDAYTHLQDKNYKMCAFIAYAAFESFVNIISKQEDKSGRLVDKFKLVYKSKVVDRKNLNTFDCYNKLLKFFESEKLSEIRNSIVHGKEDFNIWKYNEGIIASKKMFVFTSLAILFYEQSLKNLKEFDVYMKKIIIKSS